MHTWIHSTHDLTCTCGFISTCNIINTFHACVYGILYMRVTWEHSQIICESLTLVCKLVAERHCRSWIVDMAVTVDTGRTSNHLEWVSTIMGYTWFPNSPAKSRCGLDYGWVGHDQGWRKGVGGRVSWFCWQSRQCCTFCSISWPIAGQ